MENCLSDDMKIVYVKALLKKTSIPDVGNIRPESKLSVVS